MKTNSELTKRIDAEFSAAEQRLAQFRTQHVQEYYDRRQRLERFERAACTWSPGPLRATYQPSAASLAMTSRVLAECSLRPMTPARYRVYIIHTSRGLAGK